MVPSRKVSSFGRLQHLESAVQNSSDRIGKGTWQLGPLFSEVEIQDLEVSLELKILYMSHSQMLGKFEYTLPAKF